MLSNPLSQIERTKDAYAGNMQGLEKRANMTKELVDLLAMQQLKKDLDAVKRNQAMQAQGNPATIKEQMQQGLMGEYRQQAAKEMGVGPSEADTVARAQQGMPQGGQRTPQGAPQQMPQAGAQQMAQGVMSQAQPVKLAGGGIVAFQEGGLTDEKREMQELIERLRERRADAPLVPAFLTEHTITQERARRRGSPVLEDVAERIAEADVAEPSEGAIAALEGTPLEGALTRDMLPAAEGTPASGIMLAGVPDEEPATAPAEIQPAAGLAAVAQTPAKTSGEGEEPGIRELLMQKLRADIGRDPEAAGARRAAMIRRELGLDEGIATLADRKARREQAFQDMQPSRRDNLIDLLTAGGRGGITGVGVRDRQLRDAARERRMAYEDKLDDIENTSMELRRSIGTAAANEYSKAATRDLQTMNNAATVLQRMDVEDRQRVEADLTRKRQEAKLEIDRTNALGKLLGSTKTFAEAAEKLTEGISSISERIRDPYETRRALLEQRALGGDEQAKEDLKNLENTISLQIINDPEYIRLQTMLESLDTERLASQDQRAALAAGLRGVQVADVSDEDESLVASYEGR